MQRAEMARVAQASTALPKCPSPQTRKRHRMVWVGRDIKVHLFPSFCHGQGQGQDKAGTLFTGEVYWQEKQKSWH